MLTPEMVRAGKNGALVRAGIDHPAYSAEVTIAENVRNSLAGDLA